MYVTIPTCICNSTLTNKHIPSFNTTLTLIQKKKTKAKRNIETYFTSNVCTDVARPFLLNFTIIIALY